MVSMRLLRLLAFFLVRLFRAVALDSFANLVNFSYRLALRQRIACVMARIESNSHVDHFRTSFL